MSARDALSVAVQAVDAPDPWAPELPVALKTGSEVRILVIFTYGGPRQKGYAPPRFAATLALDGKVIKAGPTSAKELGILDPDAKQADFGSDADLPGDDYLSKRERFYDLSPEIWKAFEAGRAAKDADVRALVGEYWRLFNAITPLGIATFHVQASPDFFAWVRSSGVAPDPK